MKTLPLMFLILVSVVCISCGQNTERQKPPREDIFVLIENGGTIEEDEQEEAQRSIHYLLHNLTTLRQRRNSRNATIHIVLTALPNRISWSGTPEQLYEQAGDVQSLIAFRRSFSDLVMAFEQIETTINLTYPDTIRLYWIGKGIHVPFQNTNQAIEITVPQEVPDLALSHFLDKISSLSIYAVHADQEEPLQRYFSKHGVFQKMRDGNLTFRMLGTAQTRANLDHML